jgi:hypothetical protein
VPSLADADAVTDLVMSNSCRTSYRRDALRWLGGEESFREVSSEEDVRIEHTQRKDLVWFYATILGPMLVRLGLTYSRKSRQRRGEKVRN